MVPGLAGMAEMPYGQFAVYNVAGGVLWGTGFVLLGYFAGAAWHRVAGDASKIGLVLLVVVLIGLVLGRFLRSVRDGDEWVSARFARLPGIVWIRSRFPRQSAWLARRVDTTSPSGFLLSFVLVAGSICAWVFVGVTQDVVAKEEAALSDISVTNFVVSHRVEWVTASMKNLTWLGSNAVLIPLAVAMGLYFLFKDRSWRAAAGVAAALAGANLWFQTTKSLVARPRPPASLHMIHVSGFAFPSGHATVVVATWGMAAVLLGTGRSTRVKTALWTAASVIALLVGLSRVYLGVHWWTDVVGGFALGGLWLCALGLVLLSDRFGSIPSTWEKAEDGPTPMSGRAA
jgi:membrane-associated phospholipid phosphatase